jgi:hypothetical protein
MKRQQWLILLAVLALIVGAAAMLIRLRTHQKLGVPGIRATPVPGSVVMNIALPERVLDFTSVAVPEDKVVLDLLPKDTSYAQREYSGTNEPSVRASIILMGGDRTSIHKPEFCLAGQGWRVDQKTVVDIPIDGPNPYRLRVAKWLMTKEVADASGRPRLVRGFYVFWFVADNEQTTSHWQRLWWLARDLLRTGVLQRWAYVSYFAACEPGQEDLVFERLKALIAASVPQFQLPPGSAATMAATGPSGTAE